MSASSRCRLDGWWKKVSKKDPTARAAYDFRLLLLTYLAVCVAYIPVLVGSFFGTYRTPDILWGMICFMATYAPLFQFQRGAVGFIGEFLLFVGLYIAYRITVAEM